MKGDAMIAGAVMGMAIFILDAVAMLAGWEGTQRIATKNTLLLGVITLSLLYFTRRFAATTGEEGLSYGRALAFMALSSAFAGVLVGLGDVVLYRWIAPEAYAGVVEQSLRASKRMLRDNPIFAGNPDLLKESVAQARVQMLSPLVIILKNIVNLTMLGTLAGLFLAVFCKREANTYQP